MGLISGVLSASGVLALYSYLISAASTLSGVWDVLVGTSLVPLEAVWTTGAVQQRGGRHPGGRPGQPVLHPQAFERVKTKGGLSVKTAKPRETIPAGGPGCGGRSAC